MASIKSRLVFTDNSQVVVSELLWRACDCCSSIMCLQCHTKVFMLIPCYCDTETDARCLQHRGKETIHETVASKCWNESVERDRAAGGEFD